jgi:hypothetical protein
MNLLGRAPSTSLDEHSRSLSGAKSKGSGRPPRNDGKLLELNSMDRLALKHLEDELT